MRTIIDTYILVSLLAILTMSGCMTTEVYDVTHTIQAGTYTGLDIDVTIAYEVRCGIAKSHVAVVDSFGQIAMIGSALTADETLNLERTLHKVAKEVCL